MGRKHQILDEDGILKTAVVGCSFSICDIQYVRIEGALISVAFDTAGKVILYTKPLEVPFLHSEIEKEKTVLKKVLGGMWDERFFGVHILSGGDIEITIPESKVDPSVIKVDCEIASANDDYKVFNNGDKPN